MLFLNLVSWILLVKDQLLPSFTCFYQFISIQLFKSLNEVCKTTLIALLLYFSTKCMCIMLDSISCSHVMVRVLTSIAADDSFEHRSGQTKDYRTIICCFYAKHTALRGKGKYWLAWNQDNVSECIYRTWGEHSNHYMRTWDTIQHYTHTFCTKVKKQCY
jgi:hypothetical protein